MFDHVTIRPSNRASSRRFYEAVLARLGHATTHAGADFDEWSDFSLAPASVDRPATGHLHTAFVAGSRTEVDAFWRAGVDAGYSSDGKPGLRPEYHDRYYGGFLLDPDGNSVEAVHDGRPRDCAAVIDHIWLRVGDLEASKRFWVTIGPALGLHISRELPARFHVAGSGRSFALVDGGDRTRNVHIASPAASTPWSASFTAWRSPPAAATTVLRASGRSTTRLLRRLRTRPRRQQHRGGQPQPLVS